MNDQRGPDQPRPISKAAVVGGAVMGFIGSWLLFAFAVLVMYGSLGDSSTTIQMVIGFAALLSIPVVSGALLLSREKRQLGAGLLMGVAIGSLVGAGVCIGTVATGM